MMGNNNNMNEEEEEEERESNWFDDIGGKLYGAASKFAEDIDKLDDQLGEHMDIVSNLVVAKAAEAKSKISTSITQSIRSPKNADNDNTNNDNNSFKDERVKSLEDALRVARNEIVRQEEELKEARAATTRAASALAIRNGTSMSNNKDSNNKIIINKQKEEEIETELNSLKEKLRNAVKKGKIYETEVERLTRELETERKKKESQQQPMTTTTTLSKGKKGKKGSTTIVSSSPLPPAYVDDSVVTALNTEIGAMQKEKEEFKKQLETERMKISKVEVDLKEARKTLESAHAESANLKSEAKQLALIKSDMEDRAKNAEMQLKSFKENALQKIEEKREFSRANEEKDLKIKEMQAHVQKYKDDCEEAKAMANDMEAAVARGAAAAASSNAKASAAEKAKVVAETQLEDLRKQINLMDATGREAANSIAHRDRARQAQELAESKAAEAENVAEEANQRAENAIRESEERKKKFTHVQTQFKQIEEKLTNENDLLRDEIRALKDSLSIVSTAKFGSEKRAEEDKTRVNEIEKELASVKEGEKDLIAALAQAQAECIEARTKASVLEEMATLRKNNFDQATTVHVPLPQPETTYLRNSVNDEEEKEKIRRSEKIESIRVRVLTILGKLKGQVDKNGNPVLSVKEADQSIWGWLGNNNDSTGTRNDPLRQPPPPEEDESSSSVDDLLNHLEKWANDQGESWSAELNAQSRKSATNAMNKLRDCEKELEELRAESFRYKQEGVERSSVTVNAAAKRAQEAEQNLGELKLKLSTLEKRNKELTWQVSLLVDPDAANQSATVASSTTPVVGVLQQIIKGCTAPRRQQQQQL